MKKRLLTSMNAWDGVLSNRKQWWELDSPPQVKNLNIGVALSKRRGYRNQPLRIISGRCGSLE